LELQHIQGIDIDSQPDSGGDFLPQRGEGDKLPSQRWAMGGFKKNLHTDFPAQLG
jgi:hypothetical protein